MNYEQWPTEQLFEFLELLEDEKKRQADLYVIRHELKKRKELQDRLSGYVNKYLTNGVEDSYISDD